MLIKVFVRVFSAGWGDTGLVGVLTTISGYSDGDPVLGPLGVYGGSSRWTVAFFRRVGVSGHLGPRGRGTRVPSVSLLGRRDRALPPRSLI